MKSSFQKKGCQDLFYKSMRNDKVYYRSCTQRNEGFEKERLPQMKGANEKFHTVERQMGRGTSRGPQSERTYVCASSAHEILHDQEPMSIKLELEADDEFSMKNKALIQCMALAS